MTPFLVQRSASVRIDEIYRYTLKTWGREKADTYIFGLFEAFGKIAAGEVFSRPIPAEFGVAGFFFRYEKHVVYWKYLRNNDVGIVTILHERMHQLDRFREDYSFFHGD